MNVYYCTQYITNSFKGFDEGGQRLLEVGFEAPPVTVAGTMGARNGPTGGSKMASPSYRHA
jgi:hypothetical protein